MNTKSINAENVLLALYDNLHVFLFRKQSDFLQVQVLSADLEEISSFEMQYHFNPYLHGVVDESSIYIPTKDGLILVLDKFTGERFHEISTDNVLWITPPQFVGNRLYVLGIVPISTGQFIKTNALIVASYDENGKKILQSQTMKGFSANFTVDTAIHVVVGNIYYQFDLDCHLITTQKLSKEIDYDPIVGQQIYLASKTGTLDILKNNSIAKYYVANNLVPPLYESETESLMWFTNQGIYKISSDTIDKIIPIKKKFVFSGKVDKRFVGITDNAEILIVSGSGTQTDAIVAANQVAYPHVIGTNLIALFNNTLYSLEI